MKKIIKYLAAYCLWVVDIVLALWLVYLCRTAYLGIFSLFYERGDLAYSHTVDFLDKVLLILLGLGWLIFTVVAEERYRSGVKKDNLLKLFAKYTGLMLLCVFLADLVLFWLQGGGSNWMRWLIMAAELGIGMALIIAYNKKKIPSST